MAKTTPSGRTKNATPDTGVPSSDPKVVYNPGKAPRSYPDSAGDDHPKYANNAEQKSYSSSQGMPSMNPHKAEGNFPGVRGGRDYNK
jgi:hypothetical protein